MSIIRSAIRRSLAPLGLVGAALSLSACVVPASSAPCACPNTATATPGGPAQVAPDGRPALCASGVGVFDDESFQGRGANFGPGRHDLEVLEAAGIDNDTIRSVCVAPGCSVTLFHDYRFDGPTLVVTGDSPQLPHEFNGGTSSLEVTCN